FLYGELVLADVDLDLEPRVRQRGVRGGIRGARDQAVHLVRLLFEQVVSERELSGQGRTFRGTGRQSGGYHQAQRGDAGAPHRRRPTATATRSAIVPAAVAVPGPCISGI